MLKCVGAVLAVDLDVVLVAGVDRVADDLPALLLHSEVDAVDIEGGTEQTKQWPLGLLLVLEAAPGFEFEPGVELLALGRRGAGIESLDVVHQKFAAPTLGVVAADRRSQYGWVGLVDSATCHVDL